VQTTRLRSYTVTGFNWAVLNFREAPPLATWSSHSLAMSTSATMNRGARSDCLLVDVGVGELAVQVDITDGLTLVALIHKRSVGWLDFSFTRTPKFAPEFRNALGIVPA
jgi:hypothetical protein